MPPSRCRSWVESPRRCSGTKKGRSYWTTPTSSWR
uniref:Uncharacterized protein n=1 Tax=Anguilla anguilla TaxID=7936 RepID=A0A0E9RKK7_ANGAN